MVEMAVAGFAVLDGALVPWAEATIHVSSVAFKYGTSVFEGVRAYWNEDAQELYVFQLCEHLARLRYSQRFMRFDPAVDEQLLFDGVIALLRKNEFRQSVHLTISAFIGSPGLMTLTGPANFSIIAAPRPAIDTTQAGCSVQVSAWRRTPDASAPTRVKCNANYQNGRLASLQAAGDGYDTALMLNQAGKISEGPAMCFFMVRGGRLVTPGINSDILESITRTTVMTLAREMGMIVEERDIDRSELVDAEEAFFCGTAWEVTPIGSIDRIAIGDGAAGPMTVALRDRFTAVATGAVPDFAEWRTPVYHSANGG